MISIGGGAGVGAECNLIKLGRKVNVQQNRLRLIYGASVYGKKKITWNPPKKG